MKPEELRRRIEECKEKRLTELDLSNSWNAPNEEKLTDIPAEVFDFVWLEKLDLSSNQLSELPDSITRLQNLSTLDLSDNQLSELPDSISLLQNLSKLSLGSNQLSELGDSISLLQNLSILYLGFNQLSKIPDSITRLQNLLELYLSFNQLREIPDSIGNLQNLSYLDLSDNQLSELSDSIGNLQNLSYLDLNSNQLSSELPYSIGNLQNLSYLYLSDNQLSELPYSIGNFQNLSSLDLSDNQLSELPYCIGNLQNLSSLDLRNNQLSELPYSIGNLQNLSSLDLRNNQLIHPPFEIVNRGIWAIRAYFREIAEGEDILYEAKLIIVGEGGAGKTTLARKILDPNSPMPKAEETTKGVDVLEWHFNMNNGQDFRVNIWDFGGQEIYHATHQFFLTKRSLYLLVADSRKEHPHVDYWFNIIELFSENSPLLIVKNELGNRPVQIDEPQLKGRFANLKESLPTNLGKPQGGSGLEPIKKAIAYHISQLPHIGNSLPKTWIKVREKLKEDKRNHISLDEYLQICDQNGFKFKQESVTDGRLVLSQYFHDLGSILHFQEDQTSPLYKTVILKPKWGTDAAYKVLDNNQVKQNLGKFTTTELKQIWQDAEYQNMQSELLELMLKFKLCYPLPNAKNTYIAPQLLDSNQPEYFWNDSDNLLLRYEYDFMPRGILTRFIVEMHHFIDEPSVWKSGVLLKRYYTSDEPNVRKSGVLLKRDYTWAEVIETYDHREIKIRLSGSNKRGFLEVITDKLDQIHATFNQLNVKTLIPCNCDVCKDSQNPHFYDYSYLKKLYFNRINDERCEDSLLTVSVDSLIDDTIGRENFFKKEQNRENSAILAYRDLHVHGDLKLQTGEKSNMEENQVKRITKAETYIEQPKDSGIVTVSGSEIKDNAKIGGIINESQQKSLAEVAKEIQELLEQLSQTNSTTKPTEKMVVVGKAIDIIEDNPSLKSKIIKVLKAVGTESFKEAVDHPLVNILMAGIEAWTE